jgi:hypothetical protein
MKVNRIGKSGRGEVRIFTAFSDWVGETERISLEEGERGIRLVDGELFLCPSALSLGVLPAGWGLSDA